jgi:hypothetical protein
MSTETEAAVTIKDIAVLLNKSEDWVGRAARTQQIPGFKVGGEWRFFPSKVREHFEQPHDPWALAGRRVKRVA